MTRLHMTFALAAIYAIASQASAAPITYVDASTANTTLATGGAFTPTTTPAGGVNGDDNWSVRAFGNGGNVFTSNDSGAGVNAEDAPGLATTITGLTPGAQYNVFGYFWDGSGNWRLKASLTQAPPLADHPSVSFSADGSASSTNASPAAAGDFAVSPLLSEGDRILQQAVLGVATADANGSILIYIDDLADPTVSSTQRTWYDGVGYSLVPEPSASILAVGCVAGASLLSRRRKVGAA
ncbi:MAG: hypothetical protein H0T51_24660 [Pirellulales bacterium]|nr:hypothetical protein [Pirellulales bacterium]